MITNPENRNNACVLRHLRNPKKNKNKLTDMKIQISRFIFFILKFVVWVFVKTCVIPSSLSFPYLKGEKNDEDEGTTHYHFQICNTSKNIWI